MQTLWYVDVMVCSELIIFLLEYTGSMLLISIPYQAMLTLLHNEGIQVQYNLYVSDRLHLKTMHLFVLLFSFLFCIFALSKSKYLMHIQHIAIFLSEKNINHTDSIMLTLTRFWAHHSAGSSCNVLVRSLLLRVWDKAPFLKSVN